MTPSEWQQYELWAEKKGQWGKVASFRELDRRRTRPGIGDVGDSPAAPGRPEDHSRRDDPPVVQSDRLSVLKTAVKRAGRYPERSGGFDVEPARTVGLANGEAEGKDAVVDPRGPYLVNIRMIPDAILVDFSEVKRIQDAGEDPAQDRGDEFADPRRTGDDERFGAPGHLERHQ